MRFIKKLIFIIILLLLAFFVYRLINPLAANALLHDLKSFSNTNIGTHFSLTGEVIENTWINLDVTGTILESTWALQELTGDEELLLNDTQLSWENVDENIQTWTVVSTPCPAMPTVNSCPTGEEKYISYTSSTCGTYYACRTKTTTSTSSHGLSHKDTQDAQTLLGNFGN